MQARVTRLAGSIQIASASGHGTRIHVVVRLPGRS
jgi:signal transduction histidine kinase